MLSLKQARKALRYNSIAPKNITYSLAGVSEFFLPDKVSEMVSKIFGAEKNVGASLEIFCLSFTGII